MSTDLPQYCPSPRELDDLELLLTGGYAPVRAFNQPGSPIALELPTTLAGLAGEIELVDPEGLPLARVQLATGDVEPLSAAAYGPFRELYVAAPDVRKRYAGRTFVAVDRALTVQDLEQLASVGPLVLIVLVGQGRSALSPVALLRASLAAADSLSDVRVVAVPLGRHAGADLLDAVLPNYADNDPIVQVGDPRGELPAAVAEIVAADRPPLDQQGLVLFFTGLSGSGKSTLARALMDRVLEAGQRTITSLDGDVVRRNLSAGLTFSKQDRETNIRRIGWVAAEISRHRGLAICSPIAPFDETRQQVRALVDEAGGAFFLVHVATPLEECERRDRKGLYAKARRGEIPEFTGISSPYEAPTDADVVVDTTGRTIDDALQDVLVGLRDAGYLDLISTSSISEVSLVEPVETTDESSLVEPVETQPLSVLFVCTANICRSPFMELTARNLAAPDADLHFSSAGTHGFNDHPMDDVMATTLIPRQIPGVDDIHSRPLTREILDAADVVLTAEGTHRSFILDDFPTLFRKVFTLGQFAQAAGGTSVHGRELLAWVAKNRGRADESLDVPDPYRRGPEAAEAAASQIEGLLRVVVPALSASARITP